MTDSPASAPSEAKRSQQAAWSGRADAYQRYHGQMSMQAVGPLLDAVGIAAGGGGAGLRVLDVGCGPGYGAAEAARRGAFAVGLDLSPAMVGLAAGNVPGAAFVQGDGEALPFAEGAFDAVISSFAMPQMPDPARAVAEAFRVLASGGRTGMALRAGVENDANKRLVETAVAAHGDARGGAGAAPSDGGLRDPEAYGGLLAAAGFAGIGRADLPVIWRPRDSAELLAAIDSGSRSSRLLEGQSPQARRRIERAILAAAARFEGPDGYRIPRLAVLLTARKP